jgi:erythronate-4-phosphate dehydrogenase
MSNMSLSLLVDENIPLAQEAFGSLGTVRTMPGREMQRSDLVSTDVLLVRSVTRVGPELLSDTPVRFVGSATIGTDHVDRDWLAEEGVAFAHAPASNADSVADYVVSMALRLAVKTGSDLRNRTAGVVGCGNTGSRVARRLRALGVAVLENDPPLAEAAEARGESHPYVSLDRVVEEADLLSLHTPITTLGAHPTHHLIDGDMLDRLAPHAWLINTSRGAVVDNAALLERLTSREEGRTRTGGPQAVALDVWENEPTPDRRLVQEVDLSTPHVAGYAYDGKVRGTTMLYHSLCEHLDVDPTWTPDAALAPETPDALELSPPDPRLPRTEYLDALAQQACDVTADHRRMQGILNDPADGPGAFFSHLRKTYPTRREMQVQHVEGSAVPEAYRDAVREGLGLRLT